MSQARNTVQQSANGQHDTRRSTDANAMALAGLRIAVGLFFTIFGQYKVFSKQFADGGFQHYLESFLQGGAYPFMVPILMGIRNYGMIASLWGPLPRG